MLEQTIATAVPMMYVFRTLPPSVVLSTVRSCLRSEMCAGTVPYGALIASTAVCGPFGESNLDGGPPRGMRRAEKIRWRPPMADQRALQIEDVRGSGVYPATGPLPPGNAVVRTPAGLAHPEERAHTRRLRV